MIARQDEFAKRLLYESEYHDTQRRALSQAERRLPRPNAGSAAGTPQPRNDDDAWFDWLLTQRHGADAAYAALLRPRLEHIRDRLLDEADIRPNRVVADIGTGDGLIAFGAFEREPSTQLIFVDISPALIAYTRGVARERAIGDDARFVVASAESLDEIADASVDVVTVRAMFAYLTDRAAAVRECYRILRPGGRVSIVDPIFQDRAFALAGLARQLQYDGVGHAGRHIELLHRIGRAQLPDTLDGISADPLTNYNERDLLRLFENAGFIHLHLRLHIDCMDALPMPWAVYLRTSMRAGTPTIGEILATHLHAAERSEYERNVRHLVEAGTATDRIVNAYIFGDKPA